MPLLIMTANLSALSQNNCLTSAFVQNSCIDLCKFSE